LWLMMADMTIDLTFGDLLKLGANNKLEKGVVTITISRPVLSKVSVDPKSETGTVTFFTDESDPRVKGSKGSNG
jgi:hypothetical protein